MGAGHAGDPSPHLVITGGDPLKRQDLFNLIVEARRVGIPVSLAPSVMDLMDEPPFGLLRTLGVSSVSLSPHGVTPDRHDGIRWVADYCDRTLTMAHAYVASEDPLDGDPLCPYQP